MLLLCWFTTLIGDAQGFGYQGCGLFFKSVVITILGITFGGFIRDDSYFVKMINSIAKLTPGIYYSHRLVGDLLMKFVMPKFIISGVEITFCVFFFSMIIVLGLLRCKRLRVFVS